MLFDPPIRLPRTRDIAVHRRGRHLALRATTGTAPCAGGIKTSSGIGVLGASNTGTGIRGTSNTNNGVKGSSKTSNS